MKQGTEAASRATFAAIRYAQVWEDADILLEGLRPPPGAHCLTIASAGDNALALLTADPARVYAVDLNPSQLHCLALRVAAFRALEHPELLQLAGVHCAPGAERQALYARCRSHLEPAARGFWDSQPALIAQGIGNVGKFERYFALFRRRLLPLVHSRSTIEALLQQRPPDARARFYAERWNTWRWRMLFRVFFSRLVMGRLGRDPAFFRYVEGSVAERILSRTEYALTRLDPAENPYLQMILRGRPGPALPLYLRPEHFATIRERLHRLEWHQATVEAFAGQGGTRLIDSFNLSDIFEYMSPENTEALLRHLVACARPGARLAYWNMLAPRSRPESMAGILHPLEDEARRLFARDKAFFYSRFVLETVKGELA